MANNGRIWLHRCLLDEWQGSRPDWGWAWCWLLMKAEWKDSVERCLKRGQLRFSVSWGPKVWGMTKKETARFLQRCENEGDIVWERGHPGRGKKETISETIPVPIAETKSGTITILKYNKYQPTYSKAETISETIPVPINVPVLKEEEERTIKKELRSSPSLKGRPGIEPVPCAPKTENSRIYNLFVELTRKNHDEPEWKPTAREAVMMRKNIKQLLDDCGYKVESLETCVEGYFQDPYARRAGFVWELFAKGPLKYKKTKTSTDAFWEAPE